MIEVWLTKRVIKVTCRIVHEDESVEIFAIASSNIRGAQREITTYLRNQNYEPVGRWEIVLPDECMRVFRTRG